MKRVLVPLLFSLFILGGAGVIILMLRGFRAGISSKDANRRFLRWQRFVFRGSYPLPPPRSRAVLLLADAVTVAVAVAALLVVGWVLWLSLAAPRATG